MKRDKGYREKTRQGKGANETEEHLEESGPAPRVHSCHASDMPLLAPPGLFWYKETRLSCHVFVFSLGRLWQQRPLNCLRKDWLHLCLQLQLLGLPKPLHLRSLPVCHLVILVMSGRGEKNYNLKNCSVFNL